MPKFQRPIEPAWVLKSYHESTTCSQPWQLSDKLFSVGPFSQAFTLEMAFRGTKIYGATGAGKSSGLGRVIGTSFLENGFGGLVLCAKSDNDELKNWEFMARIAQRQRSIIHFGIKNSQTSFSFNILDYLRSMYGQSSSDFQMNLVTLLKQITNDFKDKKLSHSDGFWDDVVDQYLTHLVTISLLIVRDSELNFTVLYEVFDKLNMDVDFDDLIENFSDMVLKNNNLRLAYQFFGKEFKNLNDKTKSVVITAISSMLFKFNIGMLKTLFSSTTNITPQWIMSGAVIVINMPVEEFGEIGKIANLIWKFAFQKAVQNRKNINEQLRPVFLWADEVQYYLSTEDVVFQSTARSKWCASVFLTQNRPSLRLALGSGAMADDAIKALDANLINSVFHQNTDDDTNTYAATIFGKKTIKVKSKSYSGIWSEKTTVTESEKEVDRVPKSTFRTLKYGGKKNKFIVESYVNFPGASLQYDFSENKNLDQKIVSIKQRDFYKQVYKNKYVYDVDFETQTTSLINNNGEGKE